MPSARCLVDLLTEADGNFKTHVSKVDVYGVDTEGNILTEDGEATITWSLQMDSRDYGVKILDVVVSSVSAMWNLVDVREPGKPKYSPGQIHWSITKDQGWVCAAEHISDGVWPMRLFPTKVEIYFPEKRITVVF